MGIRKVLTFAAGLIFCISFQSRVAIGTGSIISWSSAPVGEFCGISYTKFTGLFEGATGEAGAASYRVPFVIRTPVNPGLGNGVTVYEYPHFFESDSARLNLGYDFLFCRGFTHASVGYSNRPGDLNSILDPNVPGVFVQGDVGRDVAIMADFARALSKEGDGGALLGNNSRRRYLVGFSNSAVPIVDLLDKGMAEGLFDFSLLYTTDGRNEDFSRSVKDILTAGAFTGKVTVVNSELDELFSGAGLHDDNPAIRDRYRYYFTAGTPHIHELYQCNLADLPVSGSTPATFLPELRARFLQGHLWGRGNGAKQGPPASTQLAIPPYDGKGNAWVVDIDGILQPRLPFVELGEATFRFFNDVFPPPFSFLIGSFVEVASVAELGFSDFSAYQDAFGKAGERYKQAGAMLEEDEAFFLNRMLIDPPNTLTQNYLSHYEGAYVDADRPDCRDVP